MSTYAQQVGERLRNIRQQKGLSLHDVEERSEKEFKASVLGAYERGERSISVPRLQRLATFYAVSVEHLLPKVPVPDENGEVPEPTMSDSVCIDLKALEDNRGPEAQTLGRYLAMIQEQRGDFNGKMMTIRRDDVRALAAMLDQSPDGLIRRLGELGIRRPVYS